MSELSPIDLRPVPRRRARRVGHYLRPIAAWVHLLIALAIVLGVFAQVYLIGAYIFGAGEEALNAHKTIGWTTHGLEGVVFVAALLAWLPRTDIALSLILFAVGSAQVALASETGWVGGLHPLLALVVLGLAAALVLRGRRGVLRTARTGHDQRPIP
jgi:hypothetical protein